MTQVATKQSTETQATPETSGKEAGSTNRQNPPKSQPSSSKQETASGPGTSQKSDAPAQQVDVRMQGMQTIADRSITQFVDNFEAVENAYYDQAQPIVDQVSQALFDMASNRPLYEAVQHNLGVLMATVGQVEKTSLPKRNYKPRSLRLLQPGTYSPSSTPVLKAGK